MKFTCCAAAGGPGLLQSGAWAAFGHSRRPRRSYLPCDLIVLYWAPTSTAAVPHCPVSFRRPGVNPGPIFHDQRRHIDNRRLRCCMHPRAIPELASSNAPRHRLAKFASLRNVAVGCGSARGHCRGRGRLPRQGRTRVRLQSPLEHHCRLLPFFLCRVHMILSLDLFSSLFSPNRRFLTFRAVGGKCPPRHSKS